MSPDDFTRSLAHVAPSQADYIRQGLPETSALEFHDRYVCEKRLTPLTIDSSNDILALMKYWRTGNVEIGMIRLFDVPVSTRHGFEVGYVEADRLIMRFSGEIVAVE